MLMVVFVDQITVALGAASPGVSITNVEKFAYRVTPQPNIKPVTVMNSVAPVSLRQGHKWIEGEIHVKSEARAAIHGQATDYLPSGAAAPVVPFFEVTMIGHDASSWKVTFTGAKFSSEELAHGHDEEAITIYKFMALTGVLTGP